MLLHYLAKVKKILLISHFDLEHFRRKLTVKEFATSMKHQVLVRCNMSDVVTLVEFSEH